MKYEYTGTPQVLIDLGFIDDLQGLPNNTIEIDEDGIYEAILIKDNVAVTIADLNYYNEGNPIGAYTFTRTKWGGFTNIKYINPKPHIKYLYKLGLVKEIK